MAALLLAIDPGISTGWALFSSAGAVLDCAVGHPPTGAPFVVIEKPQVYRGRHSKGDPNDLITLAIRVGRYAYEQELAGAKVSLPLPREWKGTITKEIHHPRILRSLPEVCRRVVESRGGLRKPDMMDAVGLGRWAFTQRSLF